MQNSSDNNLFNENTEDSINFSEELHKYLSHWIWFVLAVAVALVTAFIYLKFTAPQYSATSSIMIKDNQMSGVSKELETFKDMGIVGVGSINNTANEKEVLRSRKIIGSVVDTLDLSTVYTSYETIVNKELYGINNPIKIIFDEQSNEILNQRKDTAFVVTVLSSASFMITDIEGVYISTHAFGEKVFSEIGAFKVEDKMHFEFEEESSILISLLNRASVIDMYQANVVVEVIDIDSSILSLSFIHHVKNKAEDFLNELVTQYNLDAIKDKNEVSQKTKQFIDARLYNIGEDLRLIQDRATKFKSDNEITGLSSEAQQALEIASLNNEKLIRLTTEINIAEAVLENINTRDNLDEPLPQNLVFSEGVISHSIRSYNELVILRNRLGVNAGSKNPQILQYQNEIKALKSNLKNSISNLIVSLELEFNQINIEANKIQNKISSIPLLERGFIDIARQQEIISGLYSYLLKKKEETAISLAVAVPNAKIIDVAYAPITPVSPKRKIVFLGAIFIGFMIPFIIIYLKNLLDNKVHHRKDIEDLTDIPFLGGITHSEEGNHLVVSSASRTSTAESFRLLKVNLDFMFSSSEKEKQARTVFVTSTIGGEGKSFISINLAATLSLSGKKVVLLGLDLRAPKILAYLKGMDKKGVTNYILDDTLSIDDLKFSVPEIKSLDIIASGMIPPNPSELLGHSKINKLFEQLKKDYDYLIVDTAPVNLVTDTLLLVHHADVFLYVTRANYLDKRMLSNPQALYREKKLPNMAVVLNDVDISKTDGHRYGYGNVYTDTVVFPWYKKIFHSNR
jgi:capsular exopolysaccharide synthesis family protein